MAHDFSIYQSALSNIERQKMKSERFQPANQAPCRMKTRMLAIVLLQAVRDQLKVFKKFIRRFIGINVVVIGGLQSLGDQRQESPIRHLPVTQRNRARYIRKLSRIYADTLHDIIRYRYSAGALT